MMKLYICLLPFLYQQNQLIKESKFNISEPSMIIKQEYYISTTFVKPETIVWNYSFTGLHEASVVYFEFLFNFDTIERKVACVLTVFVEVRNILLGGIYRIQICLLMHADVWQEIIIMVVVPLPIIIL